MNCEFCRKNIINLLDNNLTKEQRTEMIKHIKSCESCRKKYNYEKKINDDFKDLFRNYDPGFKSSRKSIMSKIDKDKYPLTIRKKVVYKMKKNKWIPAVAIIAVIVLSKYK